MNVLRPAKLDSRSMKPEWTHVADSTILQPVFFYKVISILENNMHLGFIMDGNRRWATARNILKKYGHSE